MLNLLVELTAEYVYRIAKREELLVFYVLENWICVRGNSNLLFQRPLVVWKFRLKYQLSRGGYHRAKKLFEFHQYFRQ